MKKPLPDALIAQVEKEREARKKWGPLGGARVRPEFIAWVAEWYASRRAARKARRTRGQ